MPGSAIDHHPHRAVRFMTTIVTFELNELPLISWKIRGLVLCIQPLYHALQAYQRTIGWHSISKSLRPSPPNDFLYQFRPIQYLGSLKTFSLNLERANIPCFTPAILLLPLDSGPYRPIVILVSLSLPSKIRS